MSEKSDWPSSEIANEWKRVGRKKGRLLYYFYDFDDFTIASLPNPQAVFGQSFSIRFPYYLEAWNKLGIIRLLSIKYPYL